MAGFGRRNGLTMATKIMETLTGSSSSRSLSGTVSSASRTGKWMQGDVDILCYPDYGHRIEDHMKLTLNSKPSHIPELQVATISPRELIIEVVPIKAGNMIVACEGDINLAIGHPIEFICLDKEEPAVRKYCGIPKTIIINCSLKVLLVEETPEKLAARIDVNERSQRDRQRRNYEMLPSFMCTSA